MQPLRRAAAAGRGGGAPRVYQVSMSSRGAPRGAPISPLPDYSLPIDEHIDKTVLPKIITKELVAEAQRDLLEDVHNQLRHEMDSFESDQWKFATGKR